MSHDREFVFSGVPLLANRMQAHFDPMLRPLTLKQWLALAIMSHLESPIRSIAVVADVLGTTHQNATKLIAALERKGFVALEPSATDARARQIVLTEKTTQFDQATAATGEQIIEQVFAGIPAKDVRTALQVLDQMSRNLTGESICPPGAQPTPETKD